MNNTWDADSYRDNFSFVPKYGEDVLKLLTVGLGSKVVDLGCGNGSLTDRLQSLGYQVMGIDASPAMLEIARKEYPNISFQQADALSFQLDKRRMPYSRTLSSIGLTPINRKRCCAMSLGTSDLAANLCVNSVVTAAERRSTAHWKNCSVSISEPIKKLSFSRQSGNMRR